MLKHEDSPQIPPQTAAEVRVTPEELAAAITALQIRKEGQPGTIAIGDAVDELGLDVTPEEVLAEVQARREQKTSKNQRKPFRVQYFLGTAAIALICYFFASPPHHPQGHTDGRYTVTTASNIFVEDLSDKNSPIKPLSAVPDDHAVRCSLGDIAFYSFQQDRDSWILIKHGGKVYVRAYSVLGEEAASGQPNQMTLHNSEAWFPNAAALTIPLDQLQRLPGTTLLATQYGGPQVGFTAIDVHLDSHAYEKW